MSNRNEIARRFYYRHRAILLKKKRIYNQIHAKEISIQRKGYYLAHRNLFKVLHEKYVKTHAKDIKTYKENYAISHQAQKRQYNAEYYQKHRTMINKRRTEYFRARKRIDVDFKLRCALRVRMNNILKDKSKTKLSLKLLGCSVEFLKKHLEKKFKLGMNWRNHGKWHIDHIKPCASFDLSKKSEQKKCFHYTNLQPLWATQNLRKGDKW